MRTALLISIVTGILGTTVTGNAGPTRFELQQMKSSSEKVKLPAPRNKSDTSIEEALLKRRSVREYSKSSVTLAEISQLLWAAQGMTGRDGSRTAPSAGALYPLEVYILAGHVDGLAAGIYRYEPRTHELTLVVKGDKRIDIYNAALEQKSIRDGAATIIISAVYERTTWKYGERGMRYVHMEAGHAAQNVYLQAVSLDLGTVVIGAFQDSRVKKIVQMADTETPLYIMPLGRK